MTKIDRYILRQFFKTLVLWYICLAGLYIVFDLFTHMDAVVSSARESGNVVLAIGRYYFFKSFQFFDILISMLIMLSAMVTLATLIRHNELVPMFAAGISQLRVVAPIIGAAILITFLAMACRELLLPRFLSDLMQNTDEIGHDIGTNIEGITDRETGLQLQGAKAHWKEKRIEAPTISLPGVLRKHGQAIQAEHAYHKMASDEHPAGMLLQNITKPQDLLKGPNLAIDDKEVVLTPANAGFLAENECFVVTNITFDQLAGGDVWRNYGSTFSLIQGFHNPALDLGEKVKSTIHSRITQPFLDMTLLLLGLPIILSKTDRNVFKALGITALIVIAFLGTKMLCSAVGVTYQNPVMGAWFPLILFVPVATYLFYDLLK